MQPVYATDALSEGDKLLDKLTACCEDLEVCADVVVVVVGKAHEHVFTVGRIASRRVIWKNSRMVVNWEGGCLGRSKVKANNGVRVCY